MRLYYAMCTRRHGCIYTEGSCAITAFSILFLHADWLRSCLDSTLFLNQVFSFVLMWSVYIPEFWLVVSFYVGLNTFHPPSLNGFQAEFFFLVMIFYIYMMFKCIIWRLRWCLWPLPCMCCIMYSGIWYVIHFDLFNCAYLILLSYYKHFSLLSPFFCLWTLSLH